MHLAQAYHNSVRVRSKILQERGGYFIPLDRIHEERGDPIPFFGLCAALSWAYWALIGGSRPCEATN
jgi:hypothetical protein